MSPQPSHGGLEELRRVCLQLGRLRAGTHLEADDPYWKADAALSPSHAQALLETIVPAEIVPMRQAARALVALFQEPAWDVASTHGRLVPGHA